MLILKTLPYSSFYPSNSLSKFTLPIKWDFQFFQTSLVSGSHLSFSDRQPSTSCSIPSAHSFISFHILRAHHSQTHCSRLTRDITLLYCLVIYHLISPITDFFFPSHTFGLPVADVEQHSTVPTPSPSLTFPVSLSSQYRPGILSQTFSWFDFPFLLQNCSSIKPYYSP